MINNELDVYHREICPFKYVTHSTVETLLAGHHFRKLCSSFAPYVCHISSSLMAGISVRWLWNMAVRTRELNADKTYKSSYSSCLENFTLVEWKIVCLQVLFSIKTFTESTGLARCLKIKLRILRKVYFLIWPFLKTEGVVLVGRQLGNSSEIHFVKLYPTKVDMV